MLSIPLTDKIPLKDKMENGEMVKVSRMKEVIKPTHTHRHAGYHELILLNKGSGFHEVDGEEHEVVAPVMYYLRPGQSHCWNFTEIPRGYVILFREELLLKEDIDLLYTFPAQIALGEQSLLFDLMAAFYTEYKTLMPGNKVCGAYLHLLISKLKQIAKLSDRNEQSNDHLFQSYKRMVNAQFMEQKQPAYYAGRLHVSLSVLNETCKKAAGKTALSIINERVLLETKLLLSATNKPVNTIAHELKFTDPPHFVKFFKAATTLTPGQYRKMALERG